MARLALVTLLAAILGCDALRVPLTARGLHASRPLPRTTQLFMEETEDAAETPAAPEPYVEPTKREYERPAEFNFLGLSLDTNEPGGALGASLIVSIGFCVVVEGIKFLDPGTAAPSAFGSITTAGM